MVSPVSDGHLRPGDGHNVSAVEPDWALHDPAPQFDRGRDQWPPLYRAAALSSYQSDEPLHTALSAPGADLYDEFTQPLWRPPRDARSIFPGEDPPSKAPQYMPDDADFETWEPEDDYDEEEFEEVPVQYGIRSVIHAILEDGHFAKPLFDSLAPSIILEHRDQLGRTLLLSACRSALGADAELDGSIGDVSWNPQTGGYHRDPFPAILSSTNTTPQHTALHSLLALGANPLATDNLGKSAIHQLLEAHDPFTVPTGRPAIIRQALQYLASHFPALVSQPSRNGTYPLHAALQRMRRHPYRDSYTDAAALEGCVLDLIAAGADARVRDGRGNTALHYVADDGLAEIWRGDETRALFYSLLNGEHGLAADVNARNAAGKTVVQFVFDDNGARADERQSRYGFTRGQPGVVVRDADAVDAEVLGHLDAAGVQWGEERDPLGSTLLHIVAKHPTERAAGRCRFLLEKGVDASVRDGEGRTAEEVAIASGNSEVAKMLESHRVGQGNV